MSHGCFNRNNHYQYIWLAHVQLPLLRVRTDKKAREFLIISKLSSHNYFDWEGTSKNQHTRTKYIRNANENYLLLARWGLSIVMKNSWGVLWGFNLCLTREKVIKLCWWTNTHKIKWDMDWIDDSQESLKRHRFSSSSVKWLRTFVINNIQFRIMY
jgi:hypothetical protein